jgi:LmbE family N-acetylglucosaminyl deacetylase
MATQHGPNGHALKGRNGFAIPAAGGNGRASGSGVLSGRLLPRHTAQQADPAPSTVRDFWVRQRLLVIAPHADDEAYGCAGTIANVKAAGGAAYVIIGSVGDLRHYNGNGSSVSATTRAAELDASMRVLGVDGYEILFTDNDSHLRLDAIPQRDLIGGLERDAAYAIDKVRPTMVILPAPSFNQDHVALFTAGLAACRPRLRAHKPFVDHVLVGDAPQLRWRPEPFRPNFYVDITDHLGSKLDALACHASQLRHFPDLGSLGVLEHLARLRGAEVGVEAAEAFECHRIVF